MKVRRRRSRTFARRSAAVLALAPLLALGCATIPVELRGDDFLPLSPSTITTDSQLGARVRWGGEIADVRHGEDDSCLDVIAKPLDDRTRPLFTDESLGRFRACAFGFYDPDIYAKGRLVTVVGTIDSETTEQFQEYDLRIPVVAAEAVHLWPPLQYVYGPPYGYPYGPWGYGAWPYHGGWGYPYGGPYLGFSYGWPYAFGYPWIFP